jgi:serine O-acetyltransferase
LNENRISSLRKTVLADLSRYNGERTFRHFWRIYLSAPQFRIVFWFRLCHHLRARKRWRLFYPWFALVLDGLRIRYGVALYSPTEIGPGLLIGHIGCIVINGAARLGGNCTVLHGVTIGSSDHKDKPGSPQIGNNVYIGAGAKILGNIVVGDNVVVGANCVVIRDVPDNAVVVGIPARIVSYEGSANYLQHAEMR